MTFSDALISGAVGLVGGIFGTFFAPWVHWSIEKKRQSLQNRKDAIKSWQGYVRGLAHDVILREFTTSGVYHALQPHLTASTIGAVDAYSVSPSLELQEEILRSLNADIAELERRWNLL